MRARRGQRRVATLRELALLIALPLVLHFLVPIAALIPAPYSCVGIPLMAAGLWVSAATSRAMTVRQ